MEQLTGDYGDGKECGICAGGDGGRLDGFGATKVECGWETKAAVLLYEDGGDAGRDGFWPAGVDDVGGGGDGSDGGFAAAGHPPISPPSGLTQWLFQGPPAERKFLVARP